MLFKIGHSAWNKNKKLTKKHKENIGRSMTGKPSIMKGKTKDSGLYPENCGFSKGHPDYTSEGNFKKGHITWNAGTSIWLEFNCLTCGKKFKVRKCHTHNGIAKYCSRKCCNESKRGQIRLDKRQRLIKICQYCGQSFEIRPCENYRKFCSRKCADIAKIGVKRMPFTQEHKDLIGKANKGNRRWGKDTNNWRGGITPLYNILRSLDEYKEWRMNCLKRDWFKCQNCDSKIKLEVHHIKPFQELVAEFLQEYNQFSPFEDRETLIRLAFKWQPFWNLDNGITLCEKGHKTLMKIKALRIKKLCIPYINC